jgi:predicted ATPase with chaperone activity
MGEYFERKGLKIGDDNPNYDTYHTHFHVVFAVNPSYFKSREYIKQETWLNEWRDVMDDQSITQVDVRRVKQTENGKEVNELAKYAAKDSDYTQSQEVFDAFYKALKGRQVMTYNGLFAEANKLFKADKLNSYIDMDNTEYVYMLLYRWGMKEYVEAERRELTDEEMKKANRALLDEAEIDED